MAPGHHYGPAPWLGSGLPAEWTSVYFNRADTQGIGFDRTSRGSNAVAQYAPQVAANFEDLTRTPENLLLWFHHLPWDYRLHSGELLWDALVEHYSQRSTGGRRDAEHLVDASPPTSMPSAFRRSQRFLEFRNAKRNGGAMPASPTFKASRSRPLPAGYSPPRHSLEYYESLCFPFAPGNPGVHSAACQSGIADDE